MTTRTPLSPEAQRILGTLAEKQRTVPDTYPLTLNALLAGCNQKTSRNPLMEIQEAAALVALETLRERGLATEVSGSRVQRYQHSMESGLDIPRQSTALLATLLLRGPQTAGELRQNSERLHAFADISAVDAFLQELAEHPDGALVVELPRAPGARENRWAHCLGEDHASDANAAQPPAPGQTMQKSRIDALEARVSQLEADMAWLKAELGTQHGASVPKPIAEISAD